MKPWEAPGRGWVVSVCSKLKYLLRLLLWSCDQPRLCWHYTTQVKSWCYFNETPTCTELILVHAKGLHTKVEGEEGEIAVDAVVLLLVAHVGAAQRRFPETQVVVRLRKVPPLKESQRNEPDSECEWPTRLHIQELFIPDPVFPVALKTCRRNFFVSC